MFTGRLVQPPGKENIASDTKMVNFFFSQDIKSVYSRGLLQEKKKSRNKGLHHTVKDSSLMTACFMWHLLNRSQLSLRMGFPEKFLH